MVMIMPQLLRQTTIEVVKAIGPLIIAVVALQFGIVRVPGDAFLEFLVGSAMALAGMVLFFMGIDMGILPIGRFVGAELPRRNSLLLVASTAFLLGFVTTMAEPDVLVLSKQVDEITRSSVSASLVLYVTASGVGVFVAVAMLRIIFGFRLAYLITAAYSIVIVLSFFVPDRFVPLAYDAGSVTTGAVTAPVVLALALGLSSVLARRSSVSDGFGLLGMASVGPIIFIMLLSILLR